MQAGLAAGEAVPPEFVDLVKPHVQSFDYFLGDGLTRVVELLEPVEVWLAATLLCASDSAVIRSYVAIGSSLDRVQIVHPVTRQTHRIWFESPAVGRPLRDDGGGRHERLFPRDCREAVSSWCSCCASKSLASAMSPGCASFSENRLVAGHNICCCTAHRLVLPAGRRRCAAAQ